MPVEPFLSTQGHSVSIKQPFRPGKFNRWLFQKQVQKALFAPKCAPTFRVIKSPHSASIGWNLYFIYCPTGGLEPYHVDTIQRLKATGRALMIVQARPDLTTQDAFLMENADAFIVKSLDGYDFSAYSIGLKVLCAQIEKADVLVMNDSVFGPFSDLWATAYDTGWKFVGFTESMRFNRHLQSYAFFCFAMTAHDLSKMGSVFDHRKNYNNYEDVVFLKELRMAPRMRGVGPTGALWALDHRLEAEVRSWRMPGNLTLAMPDLLRQHGFPFIKRRLAQDPDLAQNFPAIHAELSQLGLL
jgi:lipopolysaccharide biosynthesis protein